jgi:hypothetical protein
MKYIVLVIGIAVLGVSVWGYLDDKSYEDKCGNPRGSMDCVPPVRLRSTGELAVKDKFEASDITEFIESKWFWGVVAGTVISISGVVILKANSRLKAKNNVR